MVHKNSDFDFPVSSEVVTVRKFLTYFSSEQVLEALVAKYPNIPSGARLSLDGDANCSDHAAITWEEYLEAAS